MRTHGWGGEPPADDAEARARILGATRRCLDATGSASTSDVATALGITRQTVYRYFPTNERLLNAAAIDAVIELEGQLVAHVTHHLADKRGGGGGGGGAGDAADAAVEVVAYVYETLRHDPALNRLLAPGRIATTLAGLTSSSAIMVGRSLLAGFPVDWEQVGLDAEGQHELVEHLLRTLQSLVLDPGEPPRDGAQLRAYLQRWLAPALRVRVASGPPGPGRVID